MKRFVKAALLFLGVVLILVLVILPFVQCWRLRASILAAIDGAESIRVVEHSSFFDPDQERTMPYVETVYSVVTLDRGQITSLRRDLSLSLDYTETISRGCLFVAHHRVEMLQRDGQTINLSLCFTCDDLRFGDDFHMMPIGWSGRLSAFIGSLGLRPHGPFKK